jgi:hypothetical protein
MRSLLLIFTWLLLLLPALAGAQQVRVLSEVVDFSGEIGSSQRKTIILHNESNQQKTYFLKNVRGGIGSSQKVKLCFGDQCFDPKKELAKVSIKLAPGEIYTDFYMEFEMGIAETKGTFDLYFVNSDASRCSDRPTAPAAVSPAARKPPAPPQLPAASCS